jgi:hypothetical protein
MTSRIDASSASEEQRRVATTPRVVPPASPASPFAPAWSRARRRSSEPSRANAKPPRTACEPNGGPMQAAPPIADATWSSTSLASTPRAQTVRHAPARNTVDRTLTTPNTKAALRRRADAAHAAITTAGDTTTTIEPGWPGVRLVLRSLGSIWRLDWIGPRPNAVGARSLRALARRFRTCALGVLHAVGTGWLR